MTQDYSKFAQDLQALLQRSHIESCDMGNLAAEFTKMYYMIDILTRMSHDLETRKAALVQRLAPPAHLTPTTPPPIPQQPQPEPRTIDEELDGISAWLERRRAEGNAA